MARTQHKWGWWCSYKVMRFLMATTLHKWSWYLQNNDLFLPMQSLLMSFWRPLTSLVQLIFSFPSWFHTIWFYCSHMFHIFLLQITLCFSFGSKDMITAFICLPSYSSAVLHCEHTFLGGILTVFLPMTNTEAKSQRTSLPSENKMATINMVEIYTHAALSAESKMADSSCSRTNRKRSSFTTKHFQRKSLKIFDLHPLLRLLLFVVRIITCKVRCWVTDTDTDQVL